MTDYTMPDEDELKPLLKKARKVGGRKFPSQRAVALYDEDGELIGGPRHVDDTARIEWSQDGIEVTGRGPFVGYRDLKDSWQTSVRKQRELEQARERRESE